MGDAAHLHSPAGAQGMNTGIGDAINLAWKLAAVIKNQASEQLLESYQIERRAFAEKLVKSTDRIFSLITAEGALGVNSTSGASNYSNYSSDPARLVNLARNTTNNVISVTKAWPGTKYSEAVTAWIDFNRNGIC